ncbi:DUF2269 domain-containing protein [Sulfidibacter corallicola]|uniref:DUF2269 family protein n=1 Tax=Sulfidibacter corallicola TaxID=2818388 RepID=A0A8A4TSV3_SULCO|nr:DUF2269 family protein [Sulfidibacter corallicola]QTD52620.1 DUF2269 family protein [Sulfidibacter corallicola]
MYEAVKFLHIISAMVFFGLPFTFGRWYRSCLEPGQEPALVASLQKMRQFLNVHMNIMGLVTLGTGIYLATATDMWKGPEKWVHAAPVLMLLSLFNVNIFLSAPINGFIQELSKDGDRQQVHLKIRKRIAAFSGIQHTLVTILTAMMVFRPF